MKLINAAAEWEAAGEAERKSLPAAIVKATNDPEMERKTKLSTASIRVAVRSTTKEREGRSKSWSASSWAGLVTLDECVEEVSDGYLVDAVHVVGVAVRQRDLHRLQERQLKVLQTESVAS